MKQQETETKRLVAHLRKAVGLILGIVAVFSAAAFAGGVDRSESHVTVAEQGLERFYTSHSLDDLAPTVRSLGSAVDISTIEPRNYVARRRALVQEWARVFNAIDESYSRPHPGEQIGCPIPGREPSGRQLPACADPKDIQDAGVRAAYVLELQKYRSKIRDASFQAGLHNIDDEAMLDLRLSLDAFRSVAPADFAALDAILNQAGLDQGRRRTIDSMIQGGRLP